MSTLTRTQSETFRQIEQDLQTRKPVLLTGAANGKTTLLHKTLSVIAQRDERSGGYVSSPKHRENSVLQFCTRIYWPQSSNQTLQHLMKQILAFAKMPVPGSTGKLIPAFETYMNSVADSGGMICLAIDNAELLGHRSWTLLKALNEYVDPIKDRTVGAGLLIAGDITKLKKMPLNFRIRCNEHMIGKLTDRDVIELTDSLYPGEWKYFSTEAVARLAKCPTTLQLKSVVDECVAERIRYKLPSIEANYVEEALARFAKYEQQRQRMAA